MKVTVRLANGESVLDFDRRPDSCPICHHGIEPKDTGPSCVSQETTLSPELEKIYRCPREKCGHFFIGRYCRDHVGRYKLRNCVPAELRNAPFDPAVLEVSKEFGPIYNEAYRAEQTGLALVCGPGYRKALEFLVKDYVSLLHPNEKEEIKVLALSACIARYIENPKVKEVASRAAWLGNDETHYYRIWDEKDLQDLKALIELTVSWIRMEELTKKVVGEMPKPEATKK